jgi:drug/metabolite transporter (DMT)-like permease
MNILQISVLLLIVCLVSLGQIFFKLCTNEIKLDGTFDSWFNMWLFLGIGAYGLSFLLWLMTIKNIQLSMATPITGLIFVLLPIMCNIFLNEKLPDNYFIGSFLILLGICFTSRA